MANLDFVYNPDEHEAETGFEIFPVGDYIAQATDSDYRATKSGNGKYIYLEFTVIDGPYTGRKYFDRLNVQNSNKQAMDIATSNRVPIRLTDERWGAHCQQPR